MLPSWCNDSVTVSRAPLVSSRGTKVRDWEHATSGSVAGCSFQPASTSTDFGDARQTYEADAILYAPAGSSIEADDRVTFDGTTYVVNGKPYEWRSPTGRVTHMQVRLKVWGG